MNQKNPNPYGNYGYNAPQGQTPYYSGGMPAQGGQQQAAYPQFQAQPQQQYQGGPLEASGGTLVPQNQSFILPNPNTTQAGSVNYLEDVLKLNKGKLVTVHLTFDKNPDWPSKAIKGIIESSGRDHLILSDPQTGTNYLLLVVYVDYLTFDEPIEHENPLQFATYPPR